MNLSEKHKKGFVFGLSIVMAGIAISFILPQLFGGGGGTFIWFFVWVAIAGPALLLLAVSGNKKPPVEGEVSLCANCGKSYEGTAEFCPNCGKPI